MSRVTILLGFLGTQLVAISGPAPARGQDSVDVLVRGGTVYDGSGGPARPVDVGFRGDRITFLGDAARRRIPAHRVIDATGLIVAPGFIDPHTHSYEGLASLSEERRRNTGALMQGVTTVVTGADGRGPVEVARTLDVAERLGLGTNTYALVGFGAVRGIVMGSSSAPASPAQIDSMRSLIAKGMREGAFGVGSGLFYAPQSYSTTEEVIAVLKGAAPFGGVYDTHQRDESSYTIGLLNSVREAIRIGRETGLITNLGHVKALGVDVWGYADSVLALMRAARASGHLVVADQYPWTASGTSLGSSLLPRWSQAGGRDSLLARLADSATRARILVEMRDNLRRRGGDSTLLITGGGAATQQYRGKTLREVALESGTGSAETALELIRAAGDIGVVSFNMNEGDIETFMKDPYVMTSSDGSGGHPRLYGTYPRKIRRYVIDKPVITMARMIQASSGQVAEVYGIAERGALRQGFLADLIVFDPKTIREEATYLEPTKLATGMRWVFVNGQAAVEDGVPTGALAGRGLRKAVKPAP
ncbi:MAG: N-acyl-D-amino-acid deacylase family protein [Gemmatimonadales bacterium]